MNKISNKTDIAGANRAIDRVGVLGAGTMGHGIAQVAAAAGCQVVMRDIDRAAVNRGLQSIERNLAKGIQRGKISEADRSGVLERIQTTIYLVDLHDCDLVIEAAPEKLALKQDLLRETEKLVGNDCIFATNTSSLSISEIARAAQRPAQVWACTFQSRPHYAFN